MQMLPQQWSVRDLAYYLWQLLSRRDGERPAAENWELAERLLRGERPPWLCEQPDFKAFTTN
jgi:hypothetical protein